MEGGHASDPEKQTLVLTVSHVNASNYIIRMMLILTNLPYACKPRAFKS